MSSLKNYKNIITNNRKKFLKSPKAKLGRVKSKGEKNHIPKDRHFIYNKNLMLNSYIIKNEKKNLLM